MLNIYTGQTTFNAADVISETDETLNSTNLLESKLEPHIPNINTQDSCPSRSINDEHNYTLSLSEARQKLEHELSRKEMIIKNLRKEFAVHKKRYNRQEMSIRKLKLTISSVKQKTLISGHLLQALNNNLSAIMFEILSRASGEQNTEYSEALKRFALNVYLYSPAAYRYLRESFNKCLPHVNMVRRWRAAAYARFAPNTKHELSTTVKNQTPDTQDQTILSQDLKNQTVMSLDLENQAKLSSNIENQAVWSHNVIEQALLLDGTATSALDPEEQAVSSPEIEDKAVLLPDMQDYAILSYDKDQVMLSPEIQDQTVLSCDIENQVTLSPATEDQAVSSCDIEDKAILPPNIQDQAILSHEQRDLNQTRLT